MWSMFERMLVAVTKLSARIAVRSRLGAETFRGKHGLQKGMLPASRNLGHTKEYFRATLGCSGSSSDLSSAESSARSNTIPR